MQWESAILFYDSLVYKTIFYMLDYWKGRFIQVPRTSMYRMHKSKQNLLVKRCLGTPVDINVDYSALELEYFHRIF